MPRTSLYFLFRFYTKALIHLSKKWNAFKFRVIGVKIGANANIYGLVSVSMGKNSQIEIGQFFHFSSGLNINPLSRNIRGCLSAHKGALIKIGNNVGISSASVWASQSITIGNNVKIGADTIIIDSDSHSLDFLDRRQANLDMQYKIDKPIIIEDDVLIGTRCIILKGVTIGARSIIGAGSVVAKDIPSDSVVIGNPCRVIKQKV